MLIVKLLALWAVVGLLLAAVLPLEATTNRQAAWFLFICGPVTWCIYLFHWLRRNK